jgi:hypothetical protein
MVGDESTGAPVPCLLFDAFPATVVGLIVLVVVDAPYRALWRGLWPHIGKKVFEFLPPLANSDATSAVSLITWVFGVTTPIKHSAP